MFLRLVKDEIQKKIICIKDLLETLLDIQGGSIMPGKDVLNYMVIMSYFIKIFEDGDIRQETLLKIEEIVAKKTGVNPMSIYRFTERDFKK